jgi:hypothetical protein
LGAEILRLQAYNATLTNCVKITKDKHFDVAVIGCATAIDTSAIVKMKPNLYMGSSSMPKWSDIYVVSFFRKARNFTSDLIWVSPCDPNSTVCAQEMNRINAMYQNKLIQSRGQLFDQHLINEHDDFIWSSVSATYGFSGSLLSFDNTTKFDALIQGGNNKYTRLINTRSLAFYLLWEIYIVLRAKIMQKSVAG